MRMAFTQTCAGNLNKLSVFIHGLDVLRTAVAHRCTETADELEEDVGDMSFVRNAAFDTLRYEFLRILDRKSVV